MYDDEFIPASAIVAEAMPPERDMTCPRCGKRTRPYGGFGAEPWATVGKYRCGALTWIADPVTRTVHERDNLGRLVVVVPE
jgi:hypothetical protein